MFSDNRLKQSSNKELENIRMIKAVDIARELGISKATVSLALNNRPGVSEKTKQKVIACRERLEQRRNNMTAEMEENQKPAVEKMIKIIVATSGKGIALDPEMDLWTDVLAVFCREAGKREFEISVSYVDIRKQAISDVTAKCNRDNVSGVILHATELDEEAVREFEKIRHPMVIYDNESVDAIHDCVVADNYAGIGNAVDYLMKNGITDIVYLKNEKDIYSFRKRREGFADTLLKHNIDPYREHRIIPVGNKIDNVYFNMCHYLEKNDLPEAFLMENYQVSIGVMRALREKGISVPEDVALIGVDTLPDYLTDGIRLTYVDVPHIERARLTVILLCEEMKNQTGVKSRVMTNCRLLEGDSVKTR